MTAMTPEKPSDMKQRFKNHLEQGFRKGRVPLFVVGAGATPFDLNHYTHAEWAIRQHLKQVPKNMEYEGYTLDEMPLDIRKDQGVSLLSCSTMYKWISPKRPEQAFFFSDLKTTCGGKIWRRFSRSFLFDWISKYTALFIGGSKNTPLHESMFNIQGELCDWLKPNTPSSIFSQYAKAIVLTTNFDGAIPAYIERQENPRNPSDRCIIIDSVAKIHALPRALLPASTNGNHKLPINPPTNSPFLITLRGDVYHSVCDNHICSAHKKETSVYRLISSRTRTKTDINLKMAFQLLALNFRVLFSENDEELELRFVGTNGRELAIKISEGDNKLKNHNKPLIVPNYAQLLHDGERIQIIFIKEEGLYDDKRSVWLDYDDKKKTLSLNTPSKKGDESPNQTPIDLNELVSNAETYIRDHRMLMNDMLTCPECYQERTLTISFPGLEKKEKEIAETMEAIWSVMGSAISTVCTVGFSGNSDREVVSYLARFANKNKAPWYNVVRPGGGSNTAVKAVGNRELKDKFIPLPIGREGLTEILKNVDASGANSLAMIAGNEWEECESVTGDGLWITGHNDRQIHTHRAGFKKGQTKDKEKIIIRSDFDGIGSALSDKLQSHNAEDIDIVNVSQLSLKTFWWDPIPGAQKKKTDVHNRLKHSLGVMRLTDSWFEYLIQNHSSPIGEQSQSDNDRSGWLQRIQAASILHDSGHILFSHLIEEAFSWLGWTFSPGKAYSHEQFSKIRAKALIKEVINSDSSPLITKDFCKDILALIDSKTGLHWLDALLNSPLDADKIDYVYRDQEWLELSGRLQKSDLWISDFFTGMKISGQGQIFLDEQSAVAAYQLLSERCHLYDTIYFSPKIRVLERITLEILIKYFQLRIFGQVFPKVATALLGPDKVTAHTLISRLEKDLKRLQEKTDSTSDKTDQDNLIKVIWPRNPEGKGDQIIRFLKNALIPLAVQDEAPLDLNALCIALGILDLSLLTKSKPYEELLLDKRDKGEKSVLSLLESLPVLKAIINKHDKVRIPEVEAIVEVSSWAINELTTTCATEGDDNAASCKTCEAPFGRPVCDQFKHIADMCEVVLGPSKLPKLSKVDAEGGRWVDWIFHEHCIAGPFLLRAPTNIDNVHEAERWLKSRKYELVEIGKELSRLYSGRFLLDVTGPIRVRSYSTDRIIRDSNGMPVVCDNFWVPDGDPQSWSSRSKATRPLSQVDFRSSIPQAYKLRVLIIDPSTKVSGRDSRVDKFRQICRRRGLKLEEINERENSNDT